MQDYYSKSFKTLLEQDLETSEPPVSMGQGGDEKAFEKTLDKGTDPATFNDVKDNPVHEFKQKQVAHMESKVKEWIQKVDDFAAYLNGLDKESIQAQLNTAECETMFAKIAGTESRKISRISQELKGFVESLKGYILTSTE